MEFPEVIMMQSEEWFKKNSYDGEAKAWCSEELRGKIIVLEDTKQILWVPPDGSVQCHYLTNIPTTSPVWIYETIRDALTRTKTPQDDTLHEIPIKMRHDRTQGGENEGKLSITDLISLRATFETDEIVELAREGLLP